MAHYRPPTVKKPQATDDDDWSRKYKERLQEAYTLSTMQDTDGKEKKLITSWFWTDNIWHANLVVNIKHDNLP